MAMSFGLVIIRSVVKGWGRAPGSGSKVRTLSLIVGLLAISEGVFGDMFMLGLKDHWRVSI